MQNTRLSNLLSASARLLLAWLQNPWRRTSIQLLSLLGGFFLASAISTTAGQTAWWDLQIAAILLLVCEVISAIAYRRLFTPERPPEQVLLISSLNFLKIGLIYGLFVEAFKLGS